MCVSHRNVSAHTHWNCRWITHSCSLTDLEVLCFRRDDFSSWFVHSLCFIQLSLLCLYSNFPLFGFHRLCVSSFTSSLFSPFLSFWINCNVHLQRNPVHGVWRCSRSFSVKMLSSFSLSRRVSLHWSDVAKESWSSSWEQQREGGKKGGGGGRGGGAVEKRSGLKGVSSHI